jgi:hypothetical protein
MSQDRAASCRRRFRLSAALGWSFIRCPPWDWVGFDTPSLQGPDEQRA